LELGIHVNIYDYSFTSRGRLSSILNVFFLNRLKLRKLEARYCPNKTVTKAIFFSSHFDVLTLSFYLRNATDFDFIFVDIFNILFPSYKDYKQLGFTKKFKEWYFEHIFSENLQFYFNNGKHIVGISTDNLAGTDNKYSWNLYNSLYLSNLYSPGLESNKKSLLLYDANINELGSEVALKGAELLFEALSLFERMGYVIYVKEHPRLGGSGIAHVIKSCHLISSFIPSEFIDRGAFYAEFAIASAALECANNDVNSIALIKMLEMKAGKSLKTQVSQMERFDNVTLVSSMEDLQLMLAN
jgi:hypothetical protein